MTNLLPNWPAPATIGMPVEDVDTPALIVDLDLLEANLSRMAEYANSRKLRLRPHAKMHKCPSLAQRQIALGAVGMCCQKVSEAEVMVAGGVEDVLITNEVVGAAKVLRVAELAKRARIGVCVDNAGAAQALSKAAAAAGATVDVYVEIDVGAKRCGVKPGDAALVLAKLLIDLPGLRFMGLQAYHGSAQHLRTHLERMAAITQASALAKGTRDLIIANGLPCPIVTGAGTGTFELEGASGVYNELQPGSYAFMDADYARNTTATPFAHSLTILATVMSRAPGHAVVDVGLKAHSIDSGMATVWTDARGTPLSGLDYRKASDEHGVIFPLEGGTLPALGEKLRLIPGHIDPTVNLHDWLVCVRAGKVAELWPVSARGAMW